MSNTTLRTYIDICKKSNMVVMDDLLNDLNTENVNVQTIKNKYTNISITDGEIAAMIDLKKQFPSDYKLKLTDIYHSFHCMVGGKGNAGKKSHKSPKQKKRKNSKKNKTPKSSSLFDTVTSAARSSISSVTSELQRSMEAKVNEAINGIISDILAEMQNSQELDATKLTPIIKSHLSELVRIKL